MQDQDIKLGELYSDGVTSFAGVATGHLKSLEEPSQICLENPVSSRWIPITRLTEASESQRTAFQTVQEASSVH